MDRDTGVIKNFKEGEKIPEDFIQVEEEQMTREQKLKMAVSKYDSASVLGKVFTANRKQRRAQEKLERGK